MSASYVLRGAFVLDEGGGFSGPADVQVTDGVIAAVGPNLKAPDPSVDVAGLWLMPGVIDCHAHLGLSTRPSFSPSRSRGGRSRRFETRTRPSRQA